MTMANSLRHHVFLIFILLDLISLADSLECLSCTYARSADPSIGYDCVSKALSNTVSRISCAPPYVCKAIAEMDRKMTYINSVTRNCLPIGQSCSGTICCNRAGDQPFLLCEQKCAEPLCNNLNLEEFIGMVEEESEEEEEEEEKEPIYVPAHLFDINATNDVDTSDYFFEWVLVCLIVIGVFMLAERNS